MSQMKPTLNENYLTVAVRAPNGPRQNETQTDLRTGQRAEGIVNFAVLAQRNMNDESQLWFFFHRSQIMSAFS